MSVWQSPVSRYPPTPHLLDHQTSPERAVRLVISKVEAQGGEAIFIGYGRSVRRLMGKVCRLLPAGYLGQTVTLDPASGSQAALGRRARREVRLHVRRRRPASRPADPTAHSLRGAGSPPGQGWGPGPAHDPCYEAGSRPSSPVARHVAGIGPGCGP